MEPKTKHSFEALCEALEYADNNNRDPFAKYLINALRLEISHNCKGYHIYTKDEHRILLRGYAMLEEPCVELLIACLTASKCLDFYPANLFGQIWNDENQDGLATNWHKRCPLEVKIAILTFDKPHRTNEEFIADIEKFCANDSCIKIAA